MGSIGLPHDATCRLITVECEHAYTVYRYGQDVFLPKVFIK